MEGERSPSDAFGFALWRALQGALRARRSSSKITLASSENYESLDSSSVSASDRGASTGTQTLPTSSARALPATSPFLGEPKLRSTPKNSQGKREKSAGFVREHSRRRAVSQSFPERSHELGAASKTFVADSDGPTQLTAVYSNAQRRSSVDCSKSVDRSPAVDKDKHDEAIWRDASSLCAELERVALDLGGCNGPRGIALARKRWPMLRQRACVHGDASRTGQQVALLTSSERSLTDTKVVSKSSIDLSELVMQFTDRVNMAASAWLSKVVSGTRRTATKEIHEHQPTSSADPASGQLTEMRTQAMQRNLCALECLTLLDLLGISPQQAKKMLLDHCATSMKLESDAALFRGFWERWECLLRGSSGYSISDTSEAYSSSESQRTWRSVLEVPRELFLRLEQVDMVRVLCLFELVDIEVFKSIAVEDISSAVLLLYAIGVSANDRIAKSQDETAVRICLSVLEVLSKWQQALTQSWRDHVIELETALLSIEHAIAAFVSILCTSWRSAPSVSLWTRLDELSTQRAYCAMQGVFETSVKALAFHAENPSHGHHYTLCCSVLSSFCTFLSSGNRERLTWLGNALLEGHSSVTADVMRSVAVGACLVVFRDIDAARAAKRLFLQLLGTPWRYRLLESASRLLESDPRPLEAEILAISSRGERDVGSNAKGATSGATSRSVEAEIKGHLVSADKEWALGSQPAAMQPETHSHPLPWFKNSEEHHVQSLALGSLHCLLCALYQKNLFGIAEGHGLSSALTLRIGQGARYWTRRSIYFTFEMIAALCYMLRAGTISLYADGTALALLVDISTNAIAHELRFSEKDTLTPSAGGSAPLHRAHETSRPGVAFETRTWRTCLEPSAERLVPRTIPIPEGSNSQATSAPSAEASVAATPLRESALTGDVAVGLQNAIQIFSESILDCMEQASVALFAAEPALLSFLERLIPFLAQRDRLRMLALRERYAQPVFDLETWVDRMQYILTLYLRDENARAVRLRAVRFLRDTFSTWKGLYADSFVAELVQPVLLGSWKDLRVTRGGCENPLDQTQPDSELEEELLHTIAVALSAPTSLPVFRRFINELVGLDEAVIPVVFAALETVLRESNITRASLLLAILTGLLSPSNFMAHGFGNWSRRIEWSSRNTTALERFLWLYSSANAGRSWLAFSPAGRAHAFDSDPTR
ncbi:Tuberous sclerosis 2-like protein [Cyanidiococcus yangmingshanensis]|uniref:Tuberous sclerosis 2-like protein n=1 Tax=Cyanidiococcus yangmingshanensis TaxID=2690220 RepID=A0A7J7IIL4_9RHOD|nr:Tuberous sclerosis 2-like protein [Cyanidiococcus yangmingshanensis]